LEKDLKNHMISRFLLELDHEVLEYKGECYSIVMYQSHDLFFKGKKEGTTKKSRGRRTIARKKGKPRIRTRTGKAKARTRTKTVTRASKSRL
jgi:hypothetical protein